MAFWADINSFSPVDFKYLKYLKYLNSWKCPGEPVLSGVVFEFKSPRFPSVPSLGFKFVPCTALTVLRQLCVLEFYSPFDFKKGTAWGQDAQKRIQKKLKGRMPLWRSDLLVFLWSLERPLTGFIKTSAAGYTHSWSLHGLFTGFTKTTSRYKRALQAGWSSHRPFTGIHKDRHTFHARRWSLHGLFMVFAKTIFRRIQRPLTRKKKEPPPGQSFKTARVTALQASLWW